MNIKVKRINERARIPYRATEGSAGCDLFACLDEDVTLAPGERKLIPTGIAIEIPYEKSAGFVFPRSSVSSKYGISLSNCVGVIDSDYRGEVKIPLINHSSEPYTIRNGDRIAQIVVMPVIDAYYVPADDLTETKRGEGGFGSTGK